jgi:hypothetical protein
MGGLLCYEVQQSMNWHSRDSVERDAIELAQTMREADKLEIKLSHNQTPFGALLYGFKHSERCQSIINDKGEVVAMWGVCPSDEPILGIPWMLCAPDFENVPKLRFLRGCRRFIQEAHRDYLILCNYVHKENTMAIEWLRWLGFTFTAEIAEFGVGKAPFLEFVRINEDV